MSPDRTPGYSPFKVFDKWFCRGVQSAIFHYLSCQDYKTYKAAKERAKQSEKAAKAREAEEAIITEQPRPLPQLQPLPFQTNKGWAAEIKMGRNYDPTKTTTDRRVSSGNIRRRADTGDSDRYDYYRAKNPTTGDRSPPIASRLPPPERKDEVAWIKAPPPSRAIMEGKESPTENAPQRWALCTIERTRDEKIKEIHDAWLESEDMRRRDERFDACIDIFDLSPAELAAEVRARPPQKPAKAYIPPVNYQYSKTRDMSWSSTWDSEPDVGLKATRMLDRTRGNPRISSLVAVKNDGKLEIRGASYSYDLFWNEHTRSHSVPAGTL